MLSVKEEQIDEITKALYLILSGKKASPIYIPKDHPDNEIRQVVSYVNRFIEEYNEVAEQLSRLSKGDVDFETTKGKTVILQSLKNLHTNLRHLTWTTERIASGDFGHKVDFMGDFSVAFNSMSQQLKDSREQLVKLNEELHRRNRFIRETFGRFTSDEIVETLLNAPEGLKLGGEKREVTLMMSDLRGFTALSSSMSPEQVIKFLNRYLGKMVEIILDHRGIIDEIIGDGILAFFGAPESLNNHPELAVACALKMQLAMEEINALNEADGLPHLQMGVAVNTGEVIVGNIGSEKRTKYGAVGSQVNFTGRVESFTVGGQVLISQTTYEPLSQKLDIREAVDVEMKGVPGTVKLYDVRGISGSHEAKLPDRDETLVRLTEGVALLVYGMDQKIITGSGKTAVMTHASLMSAKVMFHDAITKWEDVRMLCNIGSSSETTPEIYGKIISVTPRDDGNEALVRFTSVSAPAYGMLRQMLSNEKH